MGGPQAAGVGLRVDEYERDKLFLSLMVDLLFGKMAPEAHPLRRLAETEAASPAGAKQGLRMALNDIVEGTMQWTPAQVTDVDAQLAAAGASTLTMVRARASKKLASIEKRGAIRTETEVYLVKGVLDGDPDALTVERRERLQTLFEAYEASTGVIS